MRLNQKTLAPIVLLITLAVLIVLQWLSTGVSGETDSIGHYQIARYAFKYPEFFLNHWGKPLFTILSSPFAQLGYTGAIAFNLMCGLLSAWFAYLITKRMQYQHAWAAIIFTVFTPVYLFILFSSLTEILFSMVLMAGIYLFISKRFILSAIVISLIPFARTEGVMYIVLFIPALLWMKQYRALPFLLTGFILFGFLGWPQYDDFLWFFTKMPYTTQSADLYGSGSFWTYFNDMDYIMNYPVIILFLTGMLFIILDFGKGLKNLRDIKYVTLYFLIIPSFFGFILAQSYLWWKGLGILASLRFMACVLPLGAIIAVTGFEWVMLKARAWRVVYYIVGLYIIALVVYKPFTYKVVPTKTGINFAVMEELAGWLKESPYSDRRAFYSDPMYPFYMDMDPYDAEKCVRTYSYENTDPATILKMGELLIWDAHFTGYEGHLPFDSLLANKKMRLLKTFTPVENFTIIGGENYKLAIFLRAPRDTSRTVYQEFYLNDFEGNLTEHQLKQVTPDFSTSGRQSILLTPDNVYSPPAEDKLKYLPDTGTISLRASVRIMNPNPDEKGQVILVISVDDADHKNYKYVVARDSDVTYRPGEWFELSRTELIERDIPVNGSYKVYVWYKGKNRIYVDDLRLEYIPVGNP
jgi:hypothetical protein